MLKKNKKKKQTNRGTPFLVPQQAVHYKSTRINEKGSHIVHCIFNILFTLMISTVYHFITNRFFFFFFFFVKLKDNLFV